MIVEYKINKINVKIRNTGIVKPDVSKHVDVMEREREHRLCSLPEVIWT